MRGAPNNPDSLLSSLHKRQPATGRWLTGTLVPASAVLLTLTGCANPGPPKPPSLHLPKPASALTAQRVGDRVRLTWTVSADTTDGGTLRLPITAAICRDTSTTPPPTPAAPTTCNSVQHLNVVPGPAQATDILPSALTSGPPTLLTYRVELFNPRNHSAGLSAPIYTVAGTAPTPVGGLTVVPRRNAALITWRPIPVSPPAPVQLHRTLVATAAGPVVPSDRKKSTKSTPPIGMKAQKTALDLILTPEKGTPEKIAADPGGTIDRTLHDGDTVSYTAQRIRTISLAIPTSVTTGKDGRPKETKASTETLELRSDPSAPITFTFHDTVPPTIPTGLAAIPGGGFGEPPSIDLSWESNPEADILGYNIYRADANSVSVFTRLNPEPIPGPSFRDLTAKPGQAYLYRVTSVDQRHNESAPGATLPGQLHP